MPDNLNVANKAFVYSKLREKGRERKRERERERENSVLIIFFNSLSIFLFNVNRCKMTCNYFFMQ